jgi:hypothetical protein
MKVIPEGAKAKEPELQYAQEFAIQYVEKIGLKQNAPEIASALLEHVVLDLSTVPPIIHFYGRSFCDLYGDGFVEMVRHMDRWIEK